MEMHQGKSNIEFYLRQIWEDTSLIRSSIQIIAWSFAAIAASVVFKLIVVPLLGLE